MTFVKENQMYKNFGFAILTSENKGKKKSQQRTEQLHFFSGFIYCQNAGKVDFFCLFACSSFIRTETF